MSNKRKKYSPEAKVALAAIKNEETVSELAAKANLSIFLHRKSKFLSAFGEET